MPAPSDAGFLAIIAILAFGGNIAAVIIGQRMTQANARQAQQAAVDAAAAAVRVAMEAKIATSKQQENAAIAQKNAAIAQEGVIDAAKELVAATRTSDVKLEAVVQAAKTTGEVLTEIASTGKATHKIVNNQKTVMLRTIAILSRQVADSRPDDRKLQEAALEAEKEADDADTSNADPETKG